MTDGYTRRKLIRAAMGGSFVFAGCQSSGYRTLDFGRPETSVTEQNTTRINVGATAHRNDVDAVKARFRDVTAIGYTETKTVVCQSSVGTVGFRGRPQITLECSQEPEYLGFRISQEGCEYRTDIDVLRLVDTDTGAEYRSVGPRSCDDPALYIPSEE